jgi:hypothetical protein
MTPRKTWTLESARARAGDLLKAHGWDAGKRRAWLKEHEQLQPNELLRAAEAALGVDRTAWRDLPKE